MLPNLISIKENREIGSDKGVKEELKAKNGKQRRYVTLGEMIIKIMIFWYVMSYSLVERCFLFGGIPEDFTLQVKKYEMEI
jgi:hypothetical protein